MNRVNESEGELKRRRKVAMEKIMGAIIESIERVRKHPLVHSIAFRLLSLYQSIYMFSLTVKKMGSIVDPLRVKTPSFTVEQVNLLIETYNSIIRDIHSHLAKKDSYVREFSTLESLKEPTVNEVAKTLFIIGINILQILSYITRWMKD